MTQTQFRADLHCHTTCSDGTLTPEEVVLLAHEIGLQGLSITDHDTIEAYAEAIPAAQRCGLLLGTGVEFSCDFNGESVHILGYDYALDNAQINALCLRHQQRRKERNAAMLEKLRRRGFVLEASELPASGTVGRPHIAQAMVNKGYVATVKEAFHRYLAEGQSCYEKGEPFSAAEAIDVLHGAGGKAFIAHPHLIDRQRIVKKMLEMPLDGIECYYAKCTPDQEQRWLRLAKERGLLYSGGSDFHGTMKPPNTLGCSWVDEAVFRQIFTSSASTQRRQDA